MSKPDRSTADAEAATRREVRAIEGAIADEAKKSQPAAPAPIPLKRIALRGGESFDFPGKKGSHGLNAGPKHTIDHEPWARRIVITYRERDDGEPEVVHLPDAWVARWPA